MHDVDWPLSGLDPAPIHAAIADSRAIVDRFTACAAEALRVGKYEAVAAWAQIAADFAWNSHAGIYASPALENMLLKVARTVERVPLRMPYAVSGERSPRRKVLHVLSIAFPTGGHTRVVERWIRNDSRESIHSVLITAVGDCAPPWLGEAASASGGWLQRLDQPSMGLLEKARAMREIAVTWADLVVLHVHPNDPLPILAFGVDSGPPVILFSHADHVFWLGGSVADVVADIRPVGQELSMRRRGVRNSALLPIPLIGRGLTLTRAEARKQLGLAEESTVLLTVASPYKLSPFGGYDFLGLNRKVLEAHPGSLLLAVGPPDSGPWAEYRTATNGRIQALGERPDLNAFYAAADIYLDSFPLGSATAMLDAGMFGIASLGLSNPLSRANMAGDITQERCATHKATREEYEEELHRLIEDPVYRKERGAEISRGVREDHIPPDWNGYLERLMAMVPARHAPAELPELRHEPDMDDFFLACIQQAAGMSVHVYDFLAMHIKYLPADARYALAVDNLLGRGIFARRRFRLKVFRGYRTPTGRELKKRLRGLWQRK